MSSLKPIKLKSIQKIPILNIISPRSKEEDRNRELVKRNSWSDENSPRVPGYVIKKGYLLKKKVGKEIRAPNWTNTWKKVFVVLKNYTLEYYWNEHRFFLRIPPQKRWKIDSTWKLKKGEVDGKEDVEIPEIGFVLRIILPDSSADNESPLNTPTTATTTTNIESQFSELFFSFPSLEAREEWFKDLCDVITGFKWIQFTKPPKHMKSSSSPANLSKMKEFTPALMDTLKMSGITEKEVKADPEGMLAIIDFASKEMILPPPQVKTTAEMQQALDQNVRMENPVPLFTNKTKIADGGFSTVYLSRRVADDKPVAIKVIERTEKTNMQHLLNEVAIMFLLRGHPNIVETYTTYVTEQEVWIVMECMFGGPLTDVLANGGGLEEDEIAYVAGEVLKGLAFMHREFRIHRDIKSDNILLGLDGEVKLSDFGFTAQLTSEEDSRTSKVGTAAWMAPEVILQSQYSQTADIWSFGMLCLEMAEKEPPYLKLSQIQRYHKIVHGPPPTLLRPEKWSVEFSNFISKILVKMPQDRANAEKMLTHPFLRRACTPEKFSKRVQIIRSHVLKNNVDKLTLSFSKNLLPV